MSLSSRLAIHFRVFVICVTSCEDLMELQRKLGLLERLQQQASLTTD